MMITKTKKIAYPYQRLLHIQKNEKNGLLSHLRPQNFFFCQKSNYNTMSMPQGQSKLTTKKSKTNLPNLVGWSNYFLSSQNNMLLFWLDCLSGAK